MGTGQAISHRRKRRLRGAVHQKRAQASPIHRERIAKAEVAKGNVYLFELNDRYDIDGKFIKNMTWRVVLIKTA
jgi:hypothetical protein